MASAQHQSKTETIQAKGVNCLRMAAQNFLVVTLFFFLALVAESFSLRSPNDSGGTTSITRIESDCGVHAKSLFPPHATQQHSSLVAYALRGGTEQQSSVGGGAVIDVNAHDSIQDKQAPRILKNALDTTGLATALVAFGNIYSNYLETWPIATKSVTAAVLFGISDQMAQTFEIRRARSKGTDKSTATILSSTNKIRSLWSGIVGFCYFGPASHYW